MTDPRKQAGQSTGEPPLVGVDTGGTFTDFVLWKQGRLKHCKVLSTPDDPSRAIAEGLERLGLATDPVRMVHGTTVGTNAVLEGKLARVAYITSRGFADVLSLGRQNRQEVYRLEQPAVAPPVNPALCFEVATRHSAEGECLARASAEELEALARAVQDSGAQAVAINLLFAFHAEEEEQRIEALFPDLFVSRASEVLPEIREFERGIATWLNSGVGPVLASYLAKLAQRLPKVRISVMQSAGTTVAADQAARHGVRLLLSGPAGGIAAARLIASHLTTDKWMTLDMGGTSTDVALLNGRIPLTSQSRIGIWPLTVPTVDIHTIGAGGGSLAWVDEGGVLQVGPESAGASPGPACYGNGGQQVTVTDANVVLGRLPPDTLLGGYLPLDPALAKSAMDELAGKLGCSRRDAALGVVRLANEHMVRALRVISVERGHNPADYGLISFGGAGGLHACELGELLGIHKVILPGMAGVLSAQGMLASEPGRDFSHAVLKTLRDIDEDVLDVGFHALEKKAMEELADEGVLPETIRFCREAELRYAGQSATIILAATTLRGLGERFHDAHETASGHRLPGPIELVNLRLGARAPAPLVRLLKKSPAEQKPELPNNVFSTELRQFVPVRARESWLPGETLWGPLIVRDPVATIWVAPGWSVEPDDWGNLLLQRPVG